MTDQRIVEGPAGELRVVPPAEMEPTELTELCWHLQQVLDRRRGARVICDAAGITDASLVAVDGLARLTVTARRHGSTMTVPGTSLALRELLALTGLDQYL